jgi:putative NADH-flavin reductase
VNIAVFGATGNIGERIVEEALSRGHQVTAIARDTSGIDPHPPDLVTAQGNVLNPDDVARTIAGHDAVVSAVGPRSDDDPRMLVEAAHSLLKGMDRVGVKRLVVVGGGGSLEVSPGVMLMDTPGFPEAWKPAAQATRAALHVYRQNADLDWTYVSPPNIIQPGERTGNFRTGGNQLLTDAEGNSTISMEDFAVAILNELEHPQHIRERFTVGY